MAITNVQAGANGKATSAISLAVAYGSSPIVGNALFAAVYSSAAQKPVLTDTLHNAWNSTISASGASGTIWIFYVARNITTGANTVTASVASSVVEMMLWEFNFGVANYATADTGAVNNGSIIAMTTGPTAITAQSDELILAYFQYVSGASTGTPGYTINIGTATDAFGEYQIVSTQGSYTATGTQNTNGLYLAVIATFYASTAPQSTVLCNTSILNLTAFEEVYPNRIPEDIYDSLSGNTMSAWGGANTLWDDKNTVWNSVNPSFVFVSTGPSYT